MLILFPTSQHVLKEPIKNIEEFRKINSRYQQEIPEEIVDEYHESIGPQSMLDVVEEDKSCHIKAHNIGKVTYQKNLNLEKTLQICSDRCSSGCFHGVLTELFKDRLNITKPTDHISIEKIKETMTAVCNDVASTTKKDVGECAHGLGHAFMMLTSKNISKSISYCDNFKRPEVIFNCVTGVYMQNYLDVTGDEIETTNNICHTHDFPAACYRYQFGVTFKPDQYNEAIQYCLSVTEKHERIGCFNGVGFRFYYLVQSSRIPLNELCKLGDEHDIKLCIQSAIGRISIYDLNRSVEICNQESGLNKEICLKAIGDKWSNMDISDYYFRR